MSTTLRVEAVRRDLGSVELAKRANIAQGYLSMIWNHECSCSPEVADRLATVLKLPRESLFMESDGRFSGSDTRCWARTEEVDGWQ